MFHVRDRAAIRSVLPKAYCAVVIDLVYSVWPCVSGLSIFAMLVLLNHHLVTCLVGVRDALCIFPFIVLDYHPLSSFLYVLPIGLETDIVDGVSAKH